MFPQYAYAKNLEKAVAAYDQTKRFIASVLYELPFGTGKHGLSSGGHRHTLLGGWQANSILTFSSGLPFTVSCYCGDRSQTGNDKNVERENLVAIHTPVAFSRPFTSSSIRRPSRPPRSGPWAPWAATRCAVQRSMRSISHCLRTSATRSEAGLGFFRPSSAPKPSPDRQSLLHQHLSRVQRVGNGFRLARPGRRRQRQHL